VKSLRIEVWALCFPFFSRHVWIIFAAYSKPKKCQAYLDHIVNGGRSSVDAHTERNSNLPTLCYAENIPRGGGVCAQAERTEDPYSGLIGWSRSFVENTNSERICSKPNAYR